MRILITTLLLCISAVIFAQVPTSFQGTLNIYQSSGASPNYEIRGVFNDTQGRYTADSADVGDKIFILDGADCVELEITSIISTTGGILRCNVTDVDAVLINPPLATGAIMEPTPNYGFPTFVDGISNDLLACIRTYFTLLVDDITSGGITGVPGNTQDTVVQTGHGLSLLNPVFVNASGNWILSNISDEDSCHMAIVTEVISADTLIITYNGLTTQPGHGYTVGSVYFVQDDGTYATTVPTNFINDIAFYVVSDSTLYITEQRPISPMTDLNGIYATSDTVPSGTIATADNFQFKWGDNYYISFNPDNDNISMRGDSTLLYLGIDGAIITDNNASKRGLEYAASGYVTQPLSLTTKEYVDNAIAAIPTDNIYTADGTTIDANRVVKVSNNISFVDTLTNEFGVKITTPLFSEEVAIGRLDATSGTKATLNESKNNIELRGNATDPLKLSFREETAQGTNFSVIRARDTLSSNTDFILPNSNGSYVQVLTTDGQGRTAWDYIDSDNIQDSTITTADLAFTPLQGSGTSGRIPRYTSANTLSDGALRDDGTLLALGGATVSGYSFYDYSTGGWRLATGTTAQRPTNAAGVFRYNSSLGYSETADGSAWLQSDFPAGTNQQTIRHNGTSWVSSNVYSNGNFLGIGAQLFTWPITISRAGVAQSQVLGIQIAGTEDGYIVWSSGSTSSYFMGKNTSGYWVMLEGNSTGTGIAYNGESNSFNVNDVFETKGTLTATWRAPSSGTQNNVLYLEGSSTSNVLTFVNSGHLGINTLTPARTLHVKGEARISDLTTDTPTLIIGADADGDLGAVPEGYGINVTGGALEVDTTQIPTQSDLSAIGLRTLFTGGADVTVANTVAETTLIPTGIGTVTLPANFLVIGKTIKIDAWGVWTADVTPSTLELRAELGGTLLCTTGANTMVTSEGGQWHAEIIFTCRSVGVSGTTYSQGEMRMSSAVDTDKLYWMRRSATNTINTTVVNAIDLTATHGAADTDNSITLTNITITVLN